MVNKSVLKSLLRDRQEENFFFSALKRQRLKDNEARKVNFKWTGRISPSDLSFSMCPYNFLREDIHKKRSASIDGLQSMEVGKALHHHYSQEARRVEDLLYPFPEFPKELKAKGRKYLPEIYFLEPEYNISGKIDLVLKLDDKPVIVDLKITARKQSDFPLETNICQIMTYIYCINKLGYYDKKVERGGLLHQNPHDRWELETYLEYKDYKEKIEDLLFNLNKERVAILEGKPSSCTYKFCGKHQ